MRSRKIDYYTHLGFVLFPSLLTLTISILAFFEPSNVTTYSFGEKVETTLWYSIPIFLFGLAALAFFFWLLRNFYMVEINDHGILILNKNRRASLTWDEIESVSKTWFREPTLKATLKDGRSFYFLTDPPHKSFGDAVAGRNNSQMLKTIKEKNKGRGL